MAAHFRFILAAFLLVAVWTAPVVGRSWPISPMPLWPLVEESDYVVLATVSRISESPASPDPEQFEFDDSLAELSIVEIWKGKPLSPLSVRFSPTMVCPAPARYVQGETVIAFLKSTSRGLVTTGLSYGTLYPDERERSIFRERIREAVALQTNGFVGEEEKRAWLVRTAADPATRWHGLYELIPASDRLHSYYDPTRAPKALIALSAPEASVLADEFVRNPSTDRTLPMILALLSGYVDEDVDRASVNATEAVMTQNHVPWWAVDVIPLVLSRAGIADPKALLIKDLDDCGRDEREAVLRAWWADGKARAGIRVTGDIDVRRPRVHGVGENTPD